MNKVIHYLGLDVHKESIAVAIAPANAIEVRRYGIIGGSLAREPAGFVWAIAGQVKPAAQPAKPELIRTCRGKVYRLDANKKMEQAR